MEAINLSETRGCIWEPIERFLEQRVEEDIFDLTRDTIWVNSFDELFDLSDSIRDTTKLNIEK